MNRDHSVVFETAPTYCISDSYVDCDGYTISSKGLLSTVVDIMVIWIHLSVSFLSFRLFILFMGFSRQEYWSGLPFPSPLDHFLSELSTMTHPSWMAQHDMAHSFIDLDKVVVHVIRLVSFLWLMDLSEQQGIYIWYHLYVESKIWHKWLL